MTDLNTDIIYRDTDDATGGFHDVQSFRAELGMGPAEISDAEIARVMMGDAQEQARIARQQQTAAPPRPTQPSAPHPAPRPSQHSTHTIRVEQPRYYDNTNALAYEYELARERNRRRDAEDMARRVANDYGYARQHYSAPRMYSPRPTTRRPPARKKKAATTRKRKTKSKSKTRKSKSKK